MFIRKLVLILFFLDAGNAFAMWTFFNLSSLLGLKHPGGAFEAAQALSLKKLKEKLHVDPCLGPAWGACQVTALANMIDCEDEPSQANIARFLLHVGFESNADVQ